MPVVLDVLYPWPVVSSIVSFLGVGDLMNLARANSECRAVLHGFAPPYPHGGLSPSSPSWSEPSDQGSARSIREDLYIGEHQTPQWKVLKGFARLNCSEPNHKKGPIPKPCRYCSMPVCEACIVKDSFAQAKPVYKTRTRRLCVDCWASGNPHACRSFTSSHQKTISYHFAPGSGDFCNCMAKDGWICAKCRDVQCDVLNESNPMCVGEGCSNPAGEGSDRRRICLWCEMPLFGGQSRVVRWDSYGQRQSPSASQTSRPPSPHDDDLILEGTNGNGAVVSLEDAGMV